MSSIQNSNKKQARKFNLIYFIDSHKTYHHKLNFTFVKFIIAFFIILNISSFVLIYISYSIIKNSATQEKYIINFKKDILNYYFEKTFLKDERKKDHENNTSMVENEIKSNESIFPTETIAEIKPSKEKNDEKKIGTPPASGATDKISEATQTATAQPKEINQTINDTNKNSATNEKKIIFIENSGVKIENPRIVQEESSAKITFSFLNSGTPKTISGNICLVILGVSPQGESKVYKIPAKLEVDHDNTPYSCASGSLVKFSRLRPSEFNITINKSEFIIKKVNVYFSNKHVQGIVVNSFEHK
ncbi:hypothetical protein [Fluviispira multicolorata]|uniref:Uncharacterized protein n=1 Tax=Fluviispira multicolorata TaxID=2654512 RepID=A0A833JCW6_9BACT|nr:hypothetical protein [Fluviispira multicolorata]KAB8027742.1 hypothetical protein GCL57_14120 [Fluviispira multicolorata]